MSSLPAYFLAAALAAAPSYAQADDWNRAMLIYLLGAGLDGEIQVGPLETAIDQSFSDVLEHLDVGGMGSFRASNGVWTHTIDAVYTGLSGERTFESGARFDAEFDQLIASYDIGYQLAERVAVLAGVRYTSLDADLALRTAAGTSRASDEKDWLDPYIGLSSAIPFNDALTMVLRADIGGFDVGSQLAWQAIARLDWNFGETFFATFGYRILDTDYEDGSGLTSFRYDVTIHGPGVGFGWRFR